MPKWDSVSINVDLLREEVENIGKDYKTLSIAAGMSDCWLSSALRHGKAGKSALKKLITLMNLIGSEVKLTDIILEDQEFPVKEPKPEKPKVEITSTAKTDDQMQTIIRQNEQILDTLLDLKATLSKWSICLADNAKVVRQISDKMSMVKEQAHDDSQALLRVWKN